MGNAAAKGYTKIDNQLLLAICNSGLSLNEIRVLLAIARLSYGWAAEDTRDRAGMKELESITGLFTNQIYLALKALKARRVLLVTHEQPTAYKINACISQWEPATNRRQPKTTISNESLPESVTNHYQTSNESLPELVTNHYQTSNESLPELVTNHYQNRERIVTKTSNESLLKPVTNHYQKTSETTTFDASLRTPKEIKEIKERKERKERKNLPSDYYQKTLKALGLPATAILAPTDHKTLIGLFEENCNFDDIKAARIKRKKNKLSWIQDTVCEERDKRLAGANDLEALQVELDRLYGGN